jgi:hypothetical protein
MISETCPAVGSCVAVGAYLDASGDQQGLIETLSAGVWTSVAAPLPANAAKNPETAVTAVTCTEVGSCVAVGGYVAKKAQYSGLIEVLSGGTWSPRQELPAGFSDVEFASVVCPVAGSCVAVGEGSSSTGGSGGVIATLSDGSWTMTAAALPPNVPTGAIGLLGSVTCPAVGSCVAVGYYSYAGLKAPTVEGFVDTLSDGQWTAAAVPVGTKKSARSVSFLYSVACPTATSCVAGGITADKAHQGGEGLLESLSSGTWSPVDVPLPAEAMPGQIGQFNDVACPAAGMCVAASDYTDSSGNQQGLIEMSTGGTWTATEAPLPDNAATDPLAALGGVSCPSAGSCVAVGSYTDTTGAEDGLVETLSDGIWTATEAPLPPTSVGSVVIASPLASATTTAARLARSDTFRLVRPLTRTTARKVTGTGTFSWAREFTGTRAVTLAGSVSQTKIKAKTFFEVVPPALSTLSCATTDSCVAAGSIDTASGEEGVTVTLSGGTWTDSETAPADATENTEAQLQSVTCAAPASCLAVGSYDDTSGGSQGLVETLTGGTWSPLEVPAPADAAADPGIALESITCPAAGSCVAVGSYVDTDGNFEALVETLAGGTWTASSVPLPATTFPDANLSSVACPAVGSCVAVGAAYDAFSLAGSGLVETLSAGTWTPSVPPVPGKTNARSESSLNGVSCPAVGSCQAVGAYASGKKALGLVETLAGGTWTPTSVPPPGSSTTGFSDLGSVSCAAVGTCVGVGSYLDAEGSFGLIDTLSDGTWTVTEAPSPSKAGASVSLSSVSCPSSGCVAVGSYLSDSEGGSEPVEGNFFDTLHGKKWTPTPAPSPAGVFLFSLNSLSCPTISSCASVGDDITLTNGRDGVIETE